VHVVEIVGVPDGRADRIAQRIGRRHAIERSWIGFTVAAVIVSNKSSVFLVWVPITITADRPRWVRDERRKANRLASALAGRWMLRSSSPGCSTLIPLPVTKSTAAISRGFPFRGHSVQMPSNDAASEIIAPAGNDMQMLPPTVAAFATLKDISRERQHSDSSGAACHSTAASNPSSSAIVQVAAISSPPPVAVSPGHRSASRSIKVSVPSCGVENSQVPPASHA
jgi:hypothetical protein